MQFCMWEFEAYILKVTRILNGAHRIFGFHGTQDTSQKIGLSKTVMVIVTFAPGLM